MEGQFNKKQNKKVTVFAIALSVISIALLVVGFLLVSSDKVVMLQSISNLSNKFETALDNSSLLDKIATSEDVGVKATFNLTSDYANANLVIDYLENQAEKKSKLSLDFTMDEESLLGVEGALANDNAYFYVDDVTPSYYYTALEYIHVMSSLKGNDYDKLIALLQESITDYIDDDEISKEKVKITYNGKDKKVNKLSYAVTNEALSGMITNFVNSLKKDQELLKSIANCVGKTTNEVETELDAFMEELTYDEVETGFYYNVYYYGFNKIVRYELADASNQPVIEYRVENQEIINFYSEGDVAVSIEVAKKQNQYEISGFLYNSEDETKMPFTGTLKDDTLTLVVNQDGVDVKLAITSTEEIKDNSYVYKNQIKLSGETQGIEVVVGTLDVNLEYYFNQKVDIDLSNSVDVNEISETDLTIIQNNIMNHPIYQLFINLAGMTEFSL